MRNLKISLCYHPTTIIFIDDDESYLNQLCKHFKKNLPCKSFTNPLVALEYLNAQPQETFINRCMEKPQDSDENSKHFSSGVDVRAIQRELVRPDRFKEVAVVIADYSMPAMNGLEFFNKIQNPNVSRLLLTGVADSDVAIEAFKKRTINNYLKKGTFDVVPVLMQEIKSLEIQYFIHLSNMLMSQADSKVLAPLEDQYVADLFYKLCLDNDIVGHYIMNNEGDFLLENRQGKLFRFSVKRIKEIEAMYQYAFDENTPESVFLALKNKEKMLVFDSTEAIDDTPTEEWESCLCPMQRIPGSDQYYFAYKKDLVHPPKASKNILSLEDYLFNA